MIARRSRLVIVVVAVALAAFVVAFVRGNADSAATVSTGVTSMDWRLLGLGVVLSAIAMWNRGLLNQTAHRAVGLRPRPAEMTRVAAVGFSAQKIVKSGGMSGLAVFVHNGRRRGYDAGVVTGACVLVAAASFVALGVLMISTIVALAWTGRLSGWWIVAGVGFATYAVVTVLVASIVTRSRGRADRLWIRVHQLGARIRRRPRPAPDLRCVDDLFAAVASARRRPADTGRMIAHAIVGKASGALILFIAASSVGVDITPTRALIVYATALGASLVSVVPGGFGVVEASTAALLVSGGAAAPAAALAVAVFRAFDMWLPLLAGVAAARGQLRAQAETVTAAPRVTVAPVAVAA